MPVKSALRALQILELLTRRGSRLKFAEIHSALDYPKASLHGLLQTMVAARWLDFDSDRQYTLGVRAFEAGAAYSAMMPLEARAQAVMERVSDLTSETVQLAVLDDFEVLYVAKVDGKHMLRLDSAVGRRLKPHATGVGKVLLASLPDEALGQWLGSQTLERYTENTLTTADALLAEVRTVRTQGFAVDNEERTAGATCVAVGVRDHTGASIAAMSVSAPAFRFRGPQRKAALAHLRAAASELSASLGYGAPGTETEER